MIRDLVNSKNPILAIVSESVTDDNWDYATYVLSKLMKIMNEDTSIQGISANQIGETVRVAVCRTKGKVYQLINPEVNWKFGSKKSLERCLTSKGCYYMRRPLLCKVTWTTADKVVLSKVFTYRSARVVLHEIDHLNGKCIDKLGKYWQFSEQAESIMKKEKAKKCKKS